MQDRPSPAPALTGGLTAALLRVAVPAVGGLLFTMLFNLVDLWFVGRLGPEAIAAVSASAFLYWSLEAVSELPTIGGRARVAQATGRGEGAAAEVQRAVAVALLLGVGCAGVGLLVAGPSLTLMGVEPAVRELGLRYLGVLMAGAHGILLLRTIEGAFHGTGDARTPMWLQSGALLANIALDPLLIFGAGPIPAMGVTGAALATVGCQLAGAGVGLLLLYRRGLLPRSGWARALAPRSHTLALLRIGAPVAGVSLVFCSVYIGLTRIVSSFGTPAVAAMGLGHRVESLGYFTALGLSAAATSVVGQCVGAGQPARAQAAGLRVMWLATVAMGALGALMVLGGEGLAAWFTGDPATRSAAAAYIHAAGWAQVGMGWWLGLAGAFAGLGRTLLPMLLVLPIVLGRLPAAWWATGPGGHGVESVWWVISLSASLNGLVMGALWLAGGTRWRRRRNPPPARM